MTIGGSSRQFGGLSAGLRLAWVRSRFWEIMMAT